MGKILNPRTGEPFVMGGFGAGGYTGGQTNRELYGWNPKSLSADAATLPQQKKLVARAYDLARNYGPVYGAIKLLRDYVVGTGLQLMYEPNWQALGIPEDEAFDWADEVEAKFQMWADSQDSHAGGTLSLTDRQNLVWWSYAVTGESLAVAEWINGSETGYKTAIQVIDPSRLETPLTKQESNRLKAGIQSSKHGAPIGYWIRAAHESDGKWTDSKDFYSWKRVAAKTRWGRKQVIHTYEQEQPGQTRGKTGLAAVLAKAHQHQKFQGVSLETAIIHSMIAGYIKSERPMEAILESLDGNYEGAENKLADLAEAQQAYYKNNSVQLGGSRLVNLLPNDEINLLQTQNQGPNYKEFDESHLRDEAAGMNMSYETYARDYSKTNYAGARAGQNDVWRSVEGHRKRVIAKHSTAEFSLWLEEAIDKGDVILPKGTPDFYTAKSAWTKCSWYGPSKGHIDPAKEEKADDLELAGNRATLKKQCAERGLNWRDVIRQKQREEAALKKAGLLTEEKQ